MVKKGDVLLYFDMDSIKKEGYKLTTPILVTNADEMQLTNLCSENSTIHSGDDLLKIQM